MFWDLGEPKTFVSQKKASCIPKKVSVSQSFLYPNMSTTFAERCIKKKAFVPQKKWHPNITGQKNADNPKPAQHLAKQKQRKIGAKIDLFAEGEGRSDLQNQVCNRARPSGIVVDLRWCPEDVKNKLIHHAERKCAENVAAKLTHANVSKTRQSLKDGHPDFFFLEIGWFKESK